MKAVKKLLLSFKYAISGVLFCVKTCRNFRIHTVAALFVLYFCRFYDFSRAESSLIYFLIGFVLALECINTAIEQLCNEVNSEFSPFIQKAKDAAAAAVLCSTVAAVAIAVKLFINKTAFIRIASFFGAPLNITVALALAVAAVIYIFYEDIFKNAK